MQPTMWRVVGYCDVFAIRGLQKKSDATSVIAIKVPLLLFISLSVPLPRLVHACMHVHVRVRVRLQPLFVQQI